MFLLTRRQVHAALAGAAAAATYLAAAEIGSKKPVKIGGLFLLSSAALAGVVGMSASGRASVKAVTTEARLNNFLANGGQIGGNVQLGGNLTMDGNDIYMGSTGTISDAGGGNFHTNGGSLFDKQGVKLAFP